MIEPVLDGSARYAGERVHRVEDSRLLTGQGTYLDDVSLPEMVHAYFVAAPIREPDSKRSTPAERLRWRACLRSSPPPT